MIIKLIAINNQNLTEAYTLTGDYKSDYNEICKRSEITPVPLKQRGQTPGLFAGHFIRKRQNCHTIYLFIYVCKESIKMAQYQFIHYNLSSIFSSLNSKLNNSDKLITSITWNRGCRGSAHNIHHKRQI